MNRPTDQHEPIDDERMRRVRAVWQDAEPASLEIACAERRIASRARGRAARSLRFLVVPAFAAAALLFAYQARRSPTPIAPVSEQAPAPILLEPAAPPAPPAPPPPPNVEALDGSRLAAAEAQHRAGQCRAAKLILEDLAATGSTADVRARAQALLDEIARMTPPP